MLGKYGIICVEDLIHEIFTVGPHFKQASNFLWPVKLSAPRGAWPNPIVTPRLLCLHTIPDLPPQPLRNLRSRASCLSNCGTPCDACASAWHAQPIALLRQLQRSVARASARHSSCA